MEVHPVRYTKAHPVAVLTCIGIGYAAARYGLGLPFLRVKLGGAVGSGDNGS